jgi:hypothetical protein
VAWRNIDQCGQRENIALHAQKAPPKRGFPSHDPFTGTPLTLAGLLLAALAGLLVALLAALARLLLLLTRTRVAALLLARLLFLVPFVRIVLVGHLMLLGVTPCNR